jgi:hypothetical protein
MGKKSLKMRGFGSRTAISTILATEYEKNKEGWGGEVYFSGSEWVLNFCGTGTSSKPGLAPAPTLRESRRIESSRAVERQ